MSIRFRVIALQQKENYSFFYAIESAPTSRSSCCICSQKITLFSLRIRFVGVNIDGFRPHNMPSSDFCSTTWFVHPDCLSRSLKRLFNNLLFSGPLNLPLTEIGTNVVDMVFRFFQGNVGRITRCVEISRYIPFYCQRVSSPQFHNILDELTTIFQKNDQAIPHTLPDLSAACLLLPLRFDACKRLRSRPLEPTPFSVSKLLSLLPFSKIKKSEATKIGSPCCSICLDDFIGTTNATRLPCMHLCHMNCLFGWFSRPVRENGILRPDKFNTFCPLCKSDAKFIVDRRFPLEDGVLFDNIDNRRAFLLLH